MDPDEALQPFEVGRQLDEVTLLRRADLVGMVAAEDLAEAFGPARWRWSAVTVPLPGNQFVIIINDTHAITRQHATLMEELFHIVLRHKPSTIRPCPITGLIKREYNKAVENEAYWSAAAALVPYPALRHMVEAGHSTEQIADHFRVSVALVGFRLKITKLWRMAVVNDR